MTGIPIAIRELRVAARRKTTYWSRVSVAFAAILFGAYELHVFQSAAGRSSGGALFNIFATALLCYCIIVGVLNSADCISKEKREGTLGLLFLTDLTGRDVALGKLFAVGANAFYGLLGVIPVLGIALVLGGVTGTEFWRTALGLLNVFFLSHAVGLTCSVFSLQSRRAVTASILCLAVFMGGPILCASVLQSAGFPGGADVVAIFSPLYPFSNSSGTEHFWKSLLLTNGIGWCFLQIASIYLPRTWKEGKRTVPQRIREGFAAWCYGSNETRARFRGRLVDKNPFWWLASRSRMGPRFVWGTLVVYGLAWLGLWLISMTSVGKGWGSWKTPTYLATTCVLHFVIKCWIASASARHIEEQRRNGSLEYLLSCTPLKISEIIEGQWLAVQRQFLWPALAILMTDFTVLIANNVSANRELSKCFGALMIMLVVDGVALCWVGMWTGLSTRKPGYAAGLAVGRILFVPWLVILFFAASTIFGTRDFTLVLYGWVFLSIMNNLVFGTRAQARLLANFRLLAVPQRAEPTGIIDRVRAGFISLVRAKIADSTPA